jgi:hypothetical protein
MFGQAVNLHFLTKYKKIYQRGNISGGEEII